MLLAEHLGHLGRHEKEQKVALNRVLSGHDQYFRHMQRVREEQIAMHEAAVEAKRSAGSVSGRRGTWENAFDSGDESNDRPTVDGVASLSASATDPESSSSVPGSRDDGNEDEGGRLSEGLSVESSDSLSHSSREYRQAMDRQRRESAEGAIAATFLLLYLYFYCYSLC